MSIINFIKAIGSMSIIEPFCWYHSFWIFADDSLSHENIEEKYSSNRLLHYPYIYSILRYVSRNYRIHSMLFFSVSTLFLFNRDIFLITASTLYYFQKQPNCLVGFLYQIQNKTGNISQQILFLSQKINFPLCIIFSLLLIFLPN